MRRNLHLALIGLGAFLVVAALLMRFYAYPTLAVAPLKQDSVTSLSAQDAVLLDLATLSNITTDLAVEARTVGDVKASEKAGDDVRVWVSTTSIRSADGQVRSRSVERAAFDAVSAEAINCCDGFSEVTEGERTPVERTGLVFKFPFETQKKDYPFWDSTLREAVTATYAGVDDLQGVKVYKFTISIPQTDLGSREVPPVLFGLDQTDPVDATVYFQSEKSILVEPHTGAILDRTDQQKQWIEYDGKQVVTTEATLSYTDAEVKEGVNDYGSLGPLLGNLKGLFPLLSGLLGLLLIGLGVALRVRREPSHA